MALNVEDKISRLDLGQRRKVEERAAELIAEEKTLRKLRKATRLTQTPIERYGQSSVIGALMQLIPGGLGSAIDAALVQTLEKVRRDRKFAFFDELAKGRIELDEALLESEDFIHCFFATTKYALNSRRREKIQMFARLLKTPLSGVGGPADVDEYEYFLSILDDLNYREFQALRILDGFGEPAGDTDAVALRWTMMIWNNFQCELWTHLGVSADETKEFMNRISRTACYREFSGTIWDYEGGMGKLTRTYMRLKEYVGEGVVESVG